MNADSDLTEEEKELAEAIADMVVVKFTDRMRALINERTGKNYCH